MAASFDTLRAARRLKEAGASDPVAEAIVTTIAEARELDLSTLATKADLAGLDAKITATELRLLKWMLGIAVAAVVAIVGALSGVIWAATQVLLHARP
jgi:sirohydrochlorin ferrochelatase